jgi:serine/threonine protein kinase
VLDRDVALTLFLAAPHDPTAAALVRSAVARAVRSARLETAGAARVLDVLEAECRDDPDGPSAAVVVAEWTPGAALVDLLDSGPLAPAVAASVLAPLAGAVDAAHSAGLILGCDRPDRIRVTPERQARFAFPGPPPTTGSRDDIRGLGAMLYLLLTGCWPLPEGPSGLPPAPLGQNGVPISPTTLRPEVPVELSTLALRSIAGPGTDGGVHTGAAVRQVLELNALTGQDDLFSASTRGDRVRPSDPLRAQRQRRIKFGVAMAALGTATLLILGYAGMQVISVFTDTGGAPLVVAAAAPKAPAPAPVPSPGLSSPVGVKSVAIYDPSELGSPDHQKDLGKLLDGNPNTGWSTDSYVDQFPRYKKGLGVMLSFDTPIAATSVTVVSPSPGTVLEIRTATSPHPRLDDTTLVGTATVRTSSTPIPLRSGPPTRYLLVWITQLSGEANHHQSKINELTIQRRIT